MQPPDNAAVWGIDEPCVLVFTTDFLTPVVDDPYDFGAIAVDNSLSDFYTMGGQPVLALNSADFPADLPVELISEVLRGGAEKAHEAGAFPGGASDSRLYYAGHVNFAASIDRILQMLLFDPQTSGGMLMAAFQFDSLIGSLHQNALKGYFMLTRKSMFSTAMDHFVQVQYVLQYIS